MPVCNGTVKQLRLEAGLSQNKFARAADLDRTTVSNAERGQDISDLTLSKIRTTLSKELGRDITEAQITR